MIKKQSTLISRLIATLDLFVISYSFFFSYSFRNALHSELGHLFPLSDYMPLFMATSFLWLFFSYFFNIYSDQYIKSRLLEIFQILKVSALAFISLSVMVFVFKLAFVSRLFLVFYVFSSTILVVISHLILRSVLRYYRLRGLNRRNIAIFGEDDTAVAMEGAIHLHSEWGLNFIGYIVENNSSGTEGLSPRIGTRDQLEKILREKVIDEIIFITTHEKLDDLEDDLLICEELGISTKIVLNILPRRISKAEFEELGGFSMLSFSTTPKNVIDLTIKRIFDLVFSLTALLLLSPVFLVASVLIKTTSRGPVFFKQVRCGKNGRQFNLLKFRSMVEDAEKIQKGLEHLNEMDGPVFKIKRDPRITAVGRMLRKYSIDETPQFINVLMGDMSMVGPRPPLPVEVQKYERWQRRRLSIKPGITCYWQISGRNKIDFETWMRMDLQYIDNWSLAEDLRIILKTIPIVLTGKGAS